MSTVGDPFSVAGLPAADGPTGLRDDAEPPDRDVTGTDGGEIDNLAASSVVDIEQFWDSVWGDNFDGTFKPVKELVSWDSGGFDGEFCGADTYGVVNAAFCVPQNKIGWDRGELLPELREANGDIAVTMVLAHEYGHSVQKQAKMVVTGTQTLVSEQQADCLSGVYMRWVAEGNSPRFTLSTGDGLNKLLAAMISFRDPLFNESDSAAVGNEHGSAFERISAFQFGFTDGPSSCEAINMTEINGRRGDLPVLLPDGQEGELPVTERSVRSIVDSMGILFSPKDPPKLTFDSQDCSDARIHEPVTYCPSSNTIIVDLPALQKIGAASRQQQPDRARRSATTRPTRSWCRATCRPSSTSAASALDTAAGGAAHRVPDGGGDGEDVEGRHPARRRHHPADRGRHRRGGVGHPRQRPGRQRRQRRLGAVGLLADRRVPGRRARRRGPLLQAVRLT